MDLTKCEGRLVRLRGGSPAHLRVGPTRLSGPSGVFQVELHHSKSGVREMVVSPEGKCGCGDDPCYMDVVGFVEPASLPVNTTVLTEVLGSC